MRTCPLTNVVPQSHHPQLGEYGNRKEVSSDRRRSWSCQGVFQQPLSGVRTVRNRNKICLRGNTEVEATAPQQSLHGGKPHTDNGRIHLWNGDARLLTFTYCVVCLLPQVIFLHIFLNAACPHSDFISLLCLVAQGKGMVIIMKEIKVFPQLIAYPMFDQSNLFINKVI